MWCRYSYWLALRLWREGRNSNYIIIYGAPPLFDGGEILRNICKMGLKSPKMAIFGEFGLQKCGISVFDFWGSIVYYINRIIYIIVENYAKKYCE